MSGVTPDSRPDALPSRALIVALSAIPLVLQLVGLTTKGYSYFIDEFYYLACASRLAFGYVDHPPLAPLMLAMIRAVLGDSLLAIRIVPFLAASGTVALTCLLVARMGGGRFAVVLGAITVGLAPMSLSMSSFFSMNAFEPLLWMLLVLTVLRIARTGESRLWVVAGLLIGLSFENKHTAVVYVAALGLGILATRTRKILADRRVLAGAAVALLLALPNILWQVAHGVPSLEFYRNAIVLKNVPSPPLMSLATLMFTMNPVTVPLWIAGFLSLFRRRNGPALRALGVTCVILLAVHVASQTSRPDRVIGIFPILFAAGAVAAERVIRPRAARIAVVAATVAGALVLAPLAIPLLPPSSTARYVTALGLKFSVERGKTSPIPQLLADRTGWESYVDDVAKVFERLSPEDRKRAIIYAPSYGHAGAIELWGPARGLPRVIGSQNSYWHWSVGHTNTEVLIAVDANANTLRTLFREVTEAGRIRCDYCMSWRNDIPIFVARGSIVPIESVWARARHYE